MTKYLKIVIGSLAILGVLSTGIYFLNKELPGCVSPNIVSKIKTDVGCFELQTVEIQTEPKITFDTNGKEITQQLGRNENGENNNLNYKYNTKTFTGNDPEYLFMLDTVKDYYNRVSQYIKDDNLQVYIYYFTKSNDFIVALNSPKLNLLNQNIKQIKRGDNKIIFTALYEYENKKAKFLYFNNFSEFDGGLLYTRYSTFNEVFKSGQYNILNLN